MVRRLWVPTAFVLLLLAPSALGQPRGKAAADALFKEGRAAFDKADYPRACAKFEESFALDRALGTRLNLALCEEKLGHLAPAREHAAALQAELSAKDDRLPIVKQLAERIEARLPRITVTLASDAPPGTVVQDERGQLLAVGTAVTVLPGDHELVITAPGHLEARVKVTLVEGQRLQRTVVPGASLAPVKDGARGGSGGGSGGARRAVGFALGGLGVAGFVVAGATGAVLLGKKSDVDAHCPNKRCDAEGLKLKADAESTPLLPLNTAAWIVGIAGVSVGAALVLTSGLGGAKKSATITLAPTAGGLALGAFGEF